MLGENPVETKFQTILRNRRALASSSRRWIAPPPFAFLLLRFSGWVNRQQWVIDYLLEENRVLRAAYGCNEFARRGEFQIEWNSLPNRPGNEPSSNHRP